MTANHTSPKIKTALSILGAAVLLTPSASALVIEPGGSSVGSYDAGAASMVGQIGAGSGIYLGSGYVLTAKHVGAGNFDLLGMTLPTIANSAQALTSPSGDPMDLLLYQVDITGNSHPILDSGINIRTTPMTSGEEVLLAGHGVGQSAPLYNAFGTQMGYSWNSSRSLQWGAGGVMQASGMSLPMGGNLTPVFNTSFTQVSGSTQGTSGDSGGAAFTYNSSTGEYELSGVMISITGQAGQSTYGRSTYIADLTRLDIPFSYTSSGSAISSEVVPEPSAALYGGVALALGLLRRRR